MPFWSLSISPTPKKPKICWIFSLQTTSTQVFFHLKIWRGRLKSTGDALDGSEIRWLHQLSLVVYPAIYWAFYIPRGFLSSTGYLCFLCGISSKSRMTVAHRMTEYHDATNGKPMVTWKVSPRFFFFEKYITANVRNFKRNSEILDLAKPKLTFARFLWKNS